MDPGLHSLVNWMDSSRQIWRKSTKNLTVSCPDYNVFWSGSLEQIFIDNREKGQAINNDRYVAQLVHLKDEISKK